MFFPRRFEGIADRDSRDRRIVGLTIPGGGPGLEFLTTPPQKFRRVFRIEDRVKGVSHGSLTLDGSKDHVNLLFDLI